MFIHVFLLGLFSACDSEKGVTIHNSEPQATIVSHSTGVEFVEGTTIDFLGQVSDDNHSNTDLMARWSTNTQTLCEESEPTVEGTTSCEGVLSVDDTQIILQVRDPEGSTSVDTIDVIVLENQAPDIVVLSPDMDTNYYSDQFILFSAQISDNEDPIDALSYNWTSSLDGALPLSEPPDGNGEISGYATLSQGLHVVTLQVTDSAGKISTRDVAVSVGAANQEPTCSILEPLSGAGVVYEQNVPFIAMVDDVDINNSMLDISWESDIDGVFNNTAASSDGSIELVYNGLSIGNHIITLSAEDEVGAVCTDTISITVGTPPTISLTQPQSSEVFSLGGVVYFEGTVSDQEDIPSDITLSWESDIDGVFSTQGSDSNGLISFTVNTLSAGLHTLIVTATDSAGLTSTINQTLQINTPPPSPLVSLSPDPAYTNDDITAVVVEVPDVDGDAVSFTYQWYKNNSLTNYSASTLPSSASSVGDTWMVHVIPSDGYIEGEFTEQSIVISNSIPTVDSLSVTPTNPSSNDTLTCSATASDIDGTSLVMNFAWQNITTGVVYTSTSSSTQSATLDLSTLVLASQDEIQCTVTVDDGFGGSASQSASVLIVNSAPNFVDATSITPSTGVYTGTSLSCFASASDTEDGVIAPTYSWYNGTSQIATGTTYTVEQSTAGVGDTITCTATVIDSLGLQAESSATVVVENSEPVLSGPTLSVLTPYNDDSLDCIASVSDADETLQLSYLWSVDGVQVGTTASLDLATTAALPGDSLVCSVLATDSQGASVSGTATTNIANRAPGAPTVSITPTEPMPGVDDLTCIVDVDSIDEDGETVSYQYEWFVNGVSSGVTSSLVPSSNTDYSQVWECVVTPYDNTTAGTAASASVILASDSCTIDASAFPVTPTSIKGYGDVSFGPYCGIWSLSGEPGHITHHQPSTGVIEYINIPTNGALLGVTYREQDGLLYVCDNNNNFFSVDPTSQQVTSLYTLSQEMQSLEVIPESYSAAYAGYLMGGTNGGEIYIIDPITGQVTLWASGSSYMSDIIFSDTGTLYVANNSQVIAVDSTGTVSTVVSGFSQADGIAYDPDNMRLFIADSSADTLSEYDLTSQQKTSLGSYDFDSGFFTSGLLWGSNGVLLLQSGESSQTHIALTP